MSRAHCGVAPEQLTDYWRKEAERQASLARHLEGQVDFERKQSRWAWWMWGVVVGALIGWCLAAWRLA